MNVAYEPSSGIVWVAICTTRAPVSSPMVSATSSGVPSSVKIVGTPAARTLSRRSASVCADACACELSDGMIAPVSSKP